MNTLKQLRRRQRRGMCKLTQKQTELIYTLHQFLIDNPTERAKISEIYCEDYDKTITYELLSITTNEYYTDIQAKMLNDVRRRYVETNCKEK